MIGKDEITHHWREHPDRTSRHASVYQQESFFDLKLDYFLKTELTPEKSLVLWGTAKKGKLVARKLLDKRVPFTWVDWRPDQYRAGIYGQPICSLDDFGKIEQPLVINTVWPSEQQRQKIDQYLNSHGLLLGQTYFVF